MRAACRGHDTELFYPAQGEVPYEALAICARCEVTDACYAEAVARKDLFGVWGGTTARQRDRSRSPREHSRIVRAARIALDALAHGQDPVQAIATRLVLTDEAAAKLARSPQVAAVIQLAAG